MLVFTLQARQQHTGVKGLGRLGSWGAVARGGKAQLRWRAAQAAVHAVAYAVMQVRDRQPLKAAVCKAG